MEKVKFLFIGLLIIWFMIILFKVDIVIKWNLEIVILFFIKECVESFIWIGLLFWIWFINLFLFVI